jgi:hypothetical protein
MPYLRRFGLYRRRTVGRGAYGSRFRRRAPYVRRTYMRPRTYGKAMVSGRGAFSLYRPRVMRGRGGFWSML